MVNAANPNKTSAMDGGSGPDAASTNGVPLTVLNKGVPPPTLSVKTYAKDVTPVVNGSGSIPAKKNGSLLLLAGSSASVPSSMLLPRAAKAAFILLPSLMKLLT